MYIVIGLLCLTVPLCAFSQFTQASSAAKALQEMNGRFFGGRNLQASFFDEGKFERQELC